MITLRHYQQEAINNIRQAYQDGSQGVFLVLPTGGGKTIVFSEILKRASEKGTKAVILAHRQELIWQASEKLKWIGVPHGVIMGRYAINQSAPIQVCSIDSLRNRNLFFTPDFIVIDEAHLIRAKRYHDFIEKYPKARRLLVSATPFRLDGKGFDGLADQLVVGSTINELIESGHLIKPRILTSPLGFDLSSIKKRGKDYDEKELTFQMSASRVIGDIVSHYQQYTPGKRAVCFAVSVEHSQKIVQGFREAGIPAEHLDGSKTEAERKAILRRLHEGTTKVVSNCNVLCEGWDEPSIECVILARPTQSEALYIQQAGRGLRTYEEIGKTECVILDHAENVARHGSILDERDYSLDGISKKKKKKKNQEKPTGLDQTVTGLQQREIDEIEGELIDISSLHPDELRLRNNYRQCLIMAKQRGYKKSWAWYQMRDRYGYHPVTLLFILGPNKAPWGLKNNPEYGDLLLESQRVRGLEEALRWSA